MCLGPPLDRTVALVFFLQYLQEAFFLQYLQEAAAVAVAAAATEEEE